MRETRTTRSGAPPADGAPRARIHPGLLALLALAAILLPSRTLDFPFLLDDDQVLENPDLRDIGRLPSLFARGYWQGWEGDETRTAGDLYRPVTMATLNLNFAVAGEDPASFRIVSFLLHGATTALVAALVARIAGSPVAGLFAGALHAVLPVHADTVVGIIHRNELLAAAFSLAALLFHRRAAERGRTPVAGPILYAIAVLAKESAAALPLAIALVDRVADRGVPMGGARGGVKRLAPYALALAVCLGARLAVLGRIGLDPESRHFSSESPLVVALTMAKFAALHYARPLLAGTPLIADFSRRSFASVSTGDGVAWACLVGWAVLGVVSIALAWRRRSLVAAGIAAALLLSLPVSNLVVRSGILGAHRVLYLPAFGVALAAGAGFAALDRRLARRALVPAAALLLAAFGVVFVRRGGAWRDGETLYRDTLSKVPENALALYNLGFLRLEKGDAAEAEPLFRRAIAADPKFFPAAHNLVGLLAETGRLDEAFALHAAAKPRDREDEAAHAHAEAVLFGRRAEPGDYERALEAARRATLLAPRDLSYRGTLASALVANGRRAEAIETLREALRRPARTRGEERNGAALAAQLRALEGRRP